MKRKWLAISRGVAPAVTGPLAPINPGGPIVEITLENVAAEPVTALTATLELSRLFDFSFEVSPASPLPPGKSISKRLTLIGGGFNDNVAYSLTLSGTLESGDTFTYTEPVQIKAPIN